MVYIRKAEIKDNAAITQLSHQLGYTISEKDSLENLENILKSKTDAVFVAVYEENVVGWIQLSKLLHLETSWFCEIVGLVIDADQRGKGIGKELLKVATKWTSDCNCNRLVVRSNVKRQKAHEFYKKAGFKNYKAQEVFEINI